MRFLTVKLVTVTALSLTLAACVPTTVPPGGTAAPAIVAAPPTPPIGENAALYAAKNDGAFVVPTVPVEKVPESFQRQDVEFASSEPVGSIIISPGEKHLYLITGKNKATRYGIAVGRAGFQWSGEATITGRQNWPKWTPPKEMIERKPELSKWADGQPGGPENPLGARALYLTTNGVDYGYRIHGTPEWSSIGKNASSGCIRMINQDVIDLYSRVQDGAKVVVLNADGTTPNGLTLPPPAPKKAKAVVKSTPKPAAPVAPAIIIPKPAVMPAPVITTAPVVAPTPTLVQPVACTVPLVNGVCPAN